MSNRIFTRMKGDELSFSGSIFSIICLLILLLKLFKVVSGSILKYIYIVLFIAMVIILSIWFFKYVYKEIEAVKCIVCISFFVVLSMVLVGLFAVDVAEKLFPSYNKEMIGFYGSILGSGISAIIGAGGSLLGAIKGGEMAKKATLECIEVQNKIQEQKKNSELIAILNVLRLEMNNNTEHVRHNELDLVDFSVWETYKQVILHLFLHDSSMVNHTIEFYKIMYSLITKEQHTINERKQRIYG